MQAAEEQKTGKNHNEATQQGSQISETQILIQSQQNRQTSQKLEFKSEFQPKHP